MIKVYLLLIAICIAQGTFLQDYAEAGTCDVNVVCSMVPYVKSCEKYEECYKDGWYYNVKYHECRKITLKDGYYPTDNFFKTKKDCDCACYQPTTISEYKNLDPTYECKSAPTFYSEGYYDSKYSGQLWYYDYDYKECVTYDYPESNYKPSFNLFYNKQNCEDFCINYLYNYQNEGGDDYNNYGDDDNKDYGHYPYEVKDTHYSGGGDADDYSKDENYKGGDNNEYANEEDDYQEDDSNYQDEDYGDDYGGNSGHEVVVDDYDTGSSMRAKGKGALMSNSLKAKGKTSSLKKRV
jgi:hypothetical protein